MSHVAETVPDLLDRLGGAAHVAGDRLVIDDAPAFRGDVIRDLAWTAAFSTDEATTLAKPQAGMWPQPFSAVGKKLQ